MGGYEAAARAAAVARIQAFCLRYEDELEINEFPQNTRWKVTHKETLGTIAEWTGAAITTRGQYIQPGRIPGPGERRLYLFIEGGTQQSVERAKAELKRVLQDIMIRVHLKYIRGKGRGLQLPTWSS
ncbi:hypothetical protein L1987_01308 [Smallanthus sonchifolius]|uniref:Uncharacterized protein n=2 Tax=Smallanthus sonchifolius TaxID=185202 RepID=A0ACB9K4Q9_9ASTR|nr:hypothetical protein L1987_01304 [Smallanthus sonchifolius]KAI3827236.1 hypothetical protein L1987_01308 [Smallanthus sonchifolius]